MKTNTILGLGVLFALGVWYFSRNKAVNVLSKTSSPTTGAVKVETIEPGKTYPQQASSITAPAGLTPTEAKMYNEINAAVAKGLPYQDIVKRYVGDAWDLAGGYDTRYPPTDYRYWEPDRQRTAEMATNWKENVPGEPLPLPLRPEYATTVRAIMVELGVDIATAQLAIVDNPSTMNRLTEEQKSKIDEFMADTGLESPASTSGPDIQKDPLTGATYITDPTTGITWVVDPKTGTTEPMEPSEGWNTTPPEPPEIIIGDGDNGVPIGMISEDGQLYDSEGNPYYY